MMQGADMTSLYHGSRNTFTAHLGICFALCPYHARAYSGGEWVTQIELDMSGLKVVEVDGYDRDSNDAPGDDGDAMGADVLVYEDEDPNGYGHKTYRLMSDAAIARISVIGSTNHKLRKVVDENRPWYSSLDECIADELDMEDMVDTFGRAAVETAWNADQ